MAPLIRVEFVGGYGAYGIGDPNPPAGGLAWSLKIKWRFTFDQPPEPQQWKRPVDKSAVNVVGWLFQHVTGSYRRTVEVNRWMDDETNPDYWEMWWVVPVDRDYAAAPYKTAGTYSPEAPATILLQYWNDAFTIGTDDLKKLSHTSLHNYEIIYRKIGKVYFMDLGHRTDVDEWLGSAHQGIAEDGKGIGSSGYLHSSRKPPANLPIHGLRRVHAIRYEPPRGHESAQVGKWAGLKEPAPALYSESALPTYSGNQLLPRGPANIGGTQAGTVTACEPE